MVADNLSRLVNEEVTLKEAEIKDEFPDEFLFLMAERPWLADMRLVLEHTGLSAIGCRMSIMCCSSSL